MPRTAKAVISWPPSVREAQSPPNHQQYSSDSSSCSYSHNFTKPALLMFLCEDVFSEALFMAGKNKDGVSSAIPLTGFCSLVAKVDKTNLSLLALSFFVGRSVWDGEFTSRLSFYCRLHLLTIIRCQKLAKRKWTLKTRRRKMCIKFKELSYWVCYTYLSVPALPALSCPSLPWFYLLLLILHISLLVGCIVEF